MPKYRNKALEIIQKQDLGPKATGKKAKSKLSKTEQKEETELTIRNIIIKNMDIKGAYAKPKITDVLWLQLLMSPYTMSKYALWHLRWTWKFTFLKKPYGDDEKLYLIRKHMQMGLHQFNGIEDEQKQSYLDMELWIKENFLAWKQEQDEEMKLSMADNPRYKQYRRYMKNHGNSRMTFEDWMCLCGSAISFHVYCFVIAKCVQIL